MTRGSPGRLDAYLQLDHEKHRVAHSTEDAEDLDREEVAGVESVPVRPHELLPRALLGALGRGHDAGGVEDIGDRVATDGDLEARVDGVANLGVAPRQIVLGDPDDEWPWCVMAWTGDTGALKLDQSTL